MKLSDIRSILTLSFFGFSLSSKAMDQVQFPAQINADSPNETIQFVTIDENAISLFSSQEESRLFLDSALQGVMIFSGLATHQTAAQYVVGLSDYQKIRLYNSLTSKLLKRNMAAKIPIVGY